MIDKIGQLKGLITIETIDSFGNIIDTYTDPNLIMDVARLNMAELVGGVTTGISINKFVIGTEGDIAGVVKTSVEGFVASKTELFSEDTVTYPDGYFYPIEFTPHGNTSGSCVVTYEIDSGSTVDLTQTDKDVTYIIELPTTAANSTGSVNYTEAALYADTKIFSMKVFTGKSKDTAVSLRITWKISF